MTDERDAELLAALRGGSQLAFNQLIDRHQQAVRTFLRGLTNAADAEDIAQETFLVAWTKAKSFKGDSSVRTWLLSIAWRKSRGWHRRWFRQARRDTAYHETATITQGESIDSADRHALGQALEQLSTEQRAAVMLCLGCGLSHAEASEALGMPLGTVKSHVQRGRSRLQEILGETA